MARNSAIPPEGFEEILAWLDPDREIAATMYVQLRRDLEKIFQWRECSDVEGLTDEVFDRVARKVHEVRPTYVGDPRLYFRAVANNLVKEDIKKARKRVALDDVDPPEPIETKSEAEAAAIDQCLESCLQKLSAENRDLIKKYYAREKQAKIDHRYELAQQFGISVQTLRVKVFRIRKLLHECIERCLEREDERQ